jgi:uncharacterized protein
MKFHSEKIKNVNKSKYILLSLAFILSSLFSYAQSDIPEKPNPPRLVNDFSKTLSKREINSLEQILQNFAIQTSNQIVVVLVKSLNGYDKVEFADLLGDKWGVGKKEKDNGIIVLIKPKTKSSRGQVRISVGYGLEGIIPDAIGKRIVENEMIPHLKQNDYYGALIKSTNVLMSLAKKEFSSNDYKKQTESKGRFGMLLPFFAIIFVVLLSRRGRSSKTYGGRNSSLPLWGMFFLGSNIDRNSHSESWSNFSGGSGGFGGFGGGGFGGGGAGGSW